jgi:hypothetical protein
VEPFPGTTPQAGQYLHVQNVTEALLYRDGRVMVYRWAERGEFPPISALLVRDSLETYVPGDRSGEWIIRGGPRSQRVQFFPEDQGPAGELAWDNLLPADGQISETRSPGGEAIRTRLDGWYSTLPTEPQALLDYLFTLFASDSSPEQSAQNVVELLIAELRSNQAPAEIRATFLSALQATDIAQIVSTQDGITTYRMRLDSMGGHTDTLSIDDVTGWATEYTMRFDREDDAQDPAPSDIPDVRMTYTVSIVDSAP